ncbi:MAG TPA: CoA-transferase subunit beta, partial [Marinobacter sp.]|nr:CoA-transferase subunit beta [Marinobacter sp.]
GWEIRFAEQLETTPEPDAKELKVLRDLKARTHAHHSGQQ